MKWISVKEKYPNSTEDVVLGFLDNEIYIGSFYATESYTLDTTGAKSNYKKIMYFRPELWLEENHCSDCDKPSEKCGGSHNQCTDCCEKDYEIALLIKDLDITHWMPMPPNPKDSE